MPANGVSGWLLLTNLKAPPGRRSISQIASGSPAASHQQVTCSGFVQASKISEGGASNSRASLIVLEARSIPRLDPGAFCNADGMSFLPLFHPGEVGFKVVQSAFPLCA